VWPFKRKKESPQEIAALERLDEGTREVAAGELDKEAARQAPMGPFAPLGLAGATEGPLEGDPDPGDERGLRETFRQGAENQRDEAG
jgi:hypothetical protein